jgi:tetratricopeptide (TPR) repeat protein
VVATFLKVSHYDFIMWDDNIHVYENPYFNPIDARNLARFWTHPYQSLYVPVAYMAFAGLAVLARTRIPNPSLTEFDTCLNPHIFHDANLLLHSVNAVLVFFLIRKIVKADMPSAIGALLFALHPLQVESVAWISELRGLLSSTFGLAAMLIHLRSEQQKDLRSMIARVSAIILFALALLAKPSVVVLPFVLVVWDTQFRGKNIKTALVYLTPWFVLATLDCLRTRAVQSLALLTPVPFWQRGIIAVDSLGFYLQKLIWPVKLGIEYGRSPHHVLTSGLEYGTIACVAFGIAICIAASRNRPWILPCALTFIIFLLPVSGIVPFIYQVFSSVADRYAYLALIGPAIAAAFMIKELSAPRLMRATYVVASIVLILLALRTSSQIATWRNTGTLFSNALVVNPADIVIRYQLAEACLRRHDYEQAETICKYLLVHGPVKYPPVLALAQSVQGEGRFAEAIGDFTKALTFESQGALALYGRAQCEESLGETTQSIDDFEASLAGMPQGTKVNYELAMQLGRAGRYGEAEEQFKVTIASNPNFLPAYYYLAMTYSKTGDSKMAEYTAKQALAIDPGFMAINRFASVASSNFGR